jgi:hypothetical protein
MVWTDTHTDELTVLPGFPVVFSIIPGAAFSRYFLVTWLILGAAVPISEALVHFPVLPAPYPAGAHLPWAALMAFIPAAAGVALGAGVRRAGLLQARSKLDSQSHGGK